MGPLLVLLFLLFPAVAAVRCFDCVGEDCMGSFCEGEYCMLSHYAPRWGTQEWGKPIVVKGCANGTLLMRDIRDHCEVAEDDADQIFTCFCNKYDNCNKNAKQLPKKRLEFITCKCDGRHCDGYRTCTGELCSYVVNHKTKEVERGCVNASIPLVERRSAGSCMIPPMTGALHHSVVQSPDDLLSTESCVCGTSFCNKAKPTPPDSGNEKKNCSASVTLDYMGNKMESKKINCTGEYCFIASIKSKMGALKEYIAKGCATFIEAGKETALRTLRNRQEKPRLWRKDEKSLPPPLPPTSECRWEVLEEDYEDDLKREEAAWVEEKDEDKKEEEEEITMKLVVNRPPEAEIPDENNTTIIAVLILSIVCIGVAGIAWKLQLHKKLMGANYTAVARAASS